MRAVDRWSFTPYSPPFHDVGHPYICRIVPGKTSVHLEWIGEERPPFSVGYRPEGDEAFSWIETEKNEITVEGLHPETDYEFVATAGDKSSRVRLARPCAIEGTVVNYLHPRDRAYGFSGQYLCSPCLIRHPDGFLLASMDVFEADRPQNLTLIFRSDDDGKTWHYVSELFPCFWGRMFIHHDKLYMIACSTEYGDLLIGCSEDGGKTFGLPTVLLRGACHPKVPGIHKNPQPPVIYGGRWWMTMEWGSWGAHYHAAMVASFPVDADPMDASSWRFSEPVRYDPTLPGVAEGKSSGNIEGTLAVLPDGSLYNIMRYDMSKCTPKYGKVLAYRVQTDDPEAPLQYDHAIDLPGNHSKFTIRYDEKSGNYYTIICRITGSEHAFDRNLLSLMKSRDGETWTLALDLLDYRDMDPKKIGFQYVDFLIEGDDLLWLCRTAWGEPHNFHDANYSVFHRLESFRKY
ncbi:MAG: hypothetical protein KBS76_00980 [Ruminococcus sp.]|nr:hypothetical protein [Candidatus Apopatosoma intestinale]